MRSKLFAVLGAMIVASYAAAELSLATAARDVASVAELAAKMRGALWLWSAIALVGAAAVALVVHAAIARRIDRLVASAKRIERGELLTRLPSAEPAPWSALAQSLEAIAANQTRSLAELRTERDLGGRILERMDEGVLVLDAGRHVVLVNAAVRDMLRPDPAALDLRGKTVLELFRHAELERLLDEADGASGRSSGEIDVGGLRPRRLLVRAARFRSGAADDGYLIVFMDVTDVRKLESLRRDFVANVSHELRTPVTAVRSAAETLRMVAGQDEDAASRFLEIIERNAERLQNLIEDLLDLSRIESRAYKLNPEAIELPKLVTYIFSLFRDRADGRRIALYARVGDDVPPLHADRRALEQILSNLVDNAVKCCNPGDAVTIDARVDERHIRVIVSDTGPGIEPQHLPRLFERFYRVDAGRSRDRGGTGLGLSIVKHLCEAMGGFIGVESRIGLGSTFTLTLPRAPVTSRPREADRARLLA